MLQRQNDWNERLTGRAFVDKPVFTDSGIVWGFGSILLRSRCDRPDLTLQDDDDRLVCLLSVAGLVPPRSDLLLLFKTALAEWDRGDKAIAAIRLAFAPVPRIAKREDAYRLYLAEQAFDAGLDPETLLKEFGLDGGVILSKYNRNQPRVPKGNGRESGEFGNQSARTEDRDDPREAIQDKPIISVFYDESKAKTLEEEGPIDILPFGGHLRHGHGHALPAPDDIGVPLFLPFLVPFLEQDKKDEGPDCPAMLPDRLHGDNAAGEREEARVAALVNPDSPTPKKTPEMPGVTSMAYYLARPTGGTVAIDDCKRSGAPSLIPGIKKGDMVEVKTAGAAKLVTVLPDTTGEDFKNQIGRQLNAIDAEGKGRSLYVCVGNQENISNLTQYFIRENPALLRAKLTVCQ